MQLITAIISLFGRQWIEHLTKKPEDRSYKDKSKKIDLRLRLANKLLRPVLDTLHPILILSIVLFIVGLLYQLWSISVSAGKPPVLMLTSTLGCIYITFTGFTSVRSFLHGIREEESPFMTATSEAVAACPILAILVSVVVELRSWAAFVASSMLRGKQRGLSVTERQLQRRHQ